MTIRYRGTVAAALAAAAVLVAGCATTIDGSPAIDPAAASAFAASTSSSGPPPSTGVTPSTGTSSNIFGSGTPIAPIAPSTSDTQGGSAIASDSVTSEVTSESASTTPDPPPTPTSSRRSAPATTSAHPSTVHGVAIGDIVTALRKDPVVADADARSAADPDELADLDDDVVDARKDGLNIWVVLIGHDVDGELTDVSDAVAKGIGGTAVVVTTAEFAVSSKQFSHAELQKAEDVAASAATSVEAASILVDQFRSIAASRTTGSARTSARTTGTSAAGGLTSFPSFRTADHSIGCMITDDTVRCDLQVKATFTPPKNPHPDCNGVYGKSIFMSKTGKPAFGCISDTVYDPHAPVLEDGGETSVGTVMCFVDGSEVSCFNLSSAHGFYLSSDDYGVF